jgi:hypothetical protein
MSFQKPRESVEPGNRVLTPTTAIGICWRWVVDVEVDMEKFSKISAAERDDEKGV